MRSLDPRTPPPSARLARSRWRRFGVAAAAGVVAPLVAAMLLFLLLDRLFPFPWETLRRPAAVEVTDRHGEPLRLFLPADERWRLPVTLDELPEDLVAAVVASEDRRFFHHAGVDPLAVARAAWSNLAAGRVISGASTIPMQIARMAEPRRRTLGAKLVEAFRALQLDAHRSKRELLELYLNLAPYGGNLEGVGAACRFTFGKPPARLSLGEIALLVALPRSPNGYDPVRRPQAARAARDRVLAQLAERGVISGRRAAQARRQPLPRRLQPVPFEAPHFARWVAAQAGEEGAGAAHRVVTTLDLRLQRSAEEQVRRRIGGLRGRGIGNAAAVVIDQETHAVLAWVGSAGFGETLFSGQVDGVLARRSPGSTLKPFLYALAFDDGGLIPDSWLLDVPRDWAGYVPENYDGRYRGRVTARQALVESLNAPAVALLAEVGLGRFHALLRRGGLATLDRPPERYGLPLILGAVEVTLADLANLYASLAEEGRYRPLRVRAAELDGSGGRGERLISRQAARQVAEILTGLERPDLPAGWQLARGVPSVAWKTGTSYGHRDAWAVGFSSRRTVGVWVGNFDGTPIYGISGARDAAPLLFDLLRAVEPGTGDLGAGTSLGEAPPRRPAETLEVCAESRRLPTPYCPRTLTVPYVPGRTRLPSCTVHRRVFVDAETGRLLAGDCLGTRPRRTRVLTVYPPELLAWWRSRSQPVPEIPEPEPGCGGAAGVTEPPKIVSPDPATPYRLRRDTPVEFQKVPLVARAAGRLFWYQNGRLVASGPPEAQIFLPLERGRHRLAVVDETGRVDRVEYRVESWTDEEKPHRGGGADHKTGAR